ncbi:NAD(P)-dependent oxidoreductase [Desulfopila sp. IMCC35008]|uniref:NAD-dependent epimerase/dehydratase family protein n=1 Tax=Desulfopila sp. IMCC35008 TaxID=2653858 RepID=UPI0013D37099|nr:NAD-dependent epimerase/dehydratase family protein [Desulfopila sp. IMCC35008]
MKVLVTGATGFIGSKVVDELLQRRIDVVTSSRSDYIEKSISWFGKTIHIFHDIHDKKTENLFEKFLQPDCIIHLAWSDLNNYFADSHLSTQLPIHKEFLLNLVKNGASQIVGAGTCFEYGLAEGKLSEETRTSPVTPYGESKVKLHHYLKGLTREFNLTYQWLRYFYMYGEGQNTASLIPLLEIAIKRGMKTFDMSGGKQERDFLPVEKIAHYTVGVSLQKIVTGAINICSGKPISVSKFVENYLKKVGSNIELNLGCYSYPDYEPMSFWGDSQKLQRAIGNG